MGLLSIKTLKLRGKSTATTTTAIIARPAFIAVAAGYMLSYGFMLIYAGSFFWDDWLNYFEKNSFQVRSKVSFSGFDPFRLVVEGWITEINPAIFQLLIFIMFPISALFLWKVFAKNKYLSEIEAISISALFLLLPVNSARASMTLFMYSFCHLSFFAAWWLFELRRRWWTVVLAITLFVLSFDTASFMLFITVPLLNSLLNTGVNSKEIRRWIGKNLLFIVLPVAYWFLERKLNPVLDPVRLAYWTPSVSGFLRGLIVGMFILLFATYLIAVKKFRYAEQRGPIQFLAGILLIWVGMFPYMTLGHFPNLSSILLGFVPGASDWDSRHQLLMPLGMGIATIGVFNYFGSSKLVRGVAAVCSISILINFTIQQDYYLDSIKTEHIITALQSTAELDNVELVIVNDQALRFNARGRFIRSYEWDGILKAAKPELNISSDYYRYVDCESIRPDAILTITANNGKLRTLLTGNPSINIAVKKITPC
jgi:hypothetical protein